MRVSLRTFLALSSVVLLTACDGLTNINATDVVQPTSLGNAAGAEAQRAGAMGTFFTTYGSGLTSVVVATGLASDEFYAGVVPSTASTPDFRAWSEPSAIGPYVGLQRSRIAALTAVDGLKQYLPALKSKTGQMYAIAGYTETCWRSRCALASRWERSTSGNGVRHADDARPRSSPLPFSTSTPRSPTRSTVRAFSISRASGKAAALLNDAKFVEAAAAVTACRRPTCTTQSFRARCRGRATSCSI